VPHPSEPRGGLDRLDRSAFAVTLLAALALYTWNLAPTVTLEDSGELIVAAHHLGVPHPPGYPIWTVLTWLVQRPVAWMTFRGHPNPAWGVAFASALFGALACANVALLVARSGRDLVARVPRLLERPGPEALGQAAAQIILDEETAAALDDEPLFQRRAPVGEEARVGGGHHLVNSRYEFESPPGRGVHGK
jgi:hypothetical protein